MIHFPKWTHRHIVNFLKLGYILILIGAFYLLRINICPADKCEVILVAFMTDYFIECIITSTVILSLGAFCLLRSL